MSTVAVTEDVRKRLLKVALELQLKLGRRVDLNEAIEYLISKETKKPELLERATRPVKGFEGAYGELIEERRRDEQRTQRKHGV